MLRSLHHLCNSTVNLKLLCKLKSVFSKDDVGNYPTTFRDFNASFSVTD